MRLRLALLLVVISAALAARVCAESTDCTTPVLMIADGRITQSIFPQNTTYWYGIYVQAGHSYSMEFEPPADNYLNATRVQFTTLAVFGPGDMLQACRGASSVVVTQNSGYAPVILKNSNGAGRRVSFTAQSAGLHLVAVTNVAGTGSYSFRAVDTTLFNVRWSTWSGYTNQWSFMNVSDMPISGTLTIYTGTLGVLAVVQISIPSGAQAFRFSSPSDLNLAANQGGYAIFSHNGPPNSIIADAYMINATGTVVTYTKFQAGTAQ
jgi:hypothetical protein